MQRITDIFANFAKTIFCAMKKILLTLIYVVMGLSAWAGDVESFNGLVERLMPQHAGRIEGRLLKGGKDRFRLSTENGRLIVEGNSANSMAVGLNHYLKYYCQTTVSWFVDDHFDAPATLPVLPQPVEVDARVEKRFFLNYCTFGYTMPWWGWRDWEHFIDWMALNGVNLPLAITGQESIWRKVWMQLGLSDEEVRTYFTGPAHLPWHRMLNIDRWGGPLPQSWLDDQEALQKRIVEREREFNMKPVLPAFSGHVPAELGRIFPKAKITKLAPWAGYSDQYACSYLDPEDPLYARIQKMFLREEIKAYGTDHIYGLDLFNELEPPSYHSDYLARQGKQTFENLRKVDSKAVWLQMTWLFYNEGRDWFAKERADGEVAQEGEEGEEGKRVRRYITSYPAERSILLDYYCEASEIWQRTNRYHGVPYVWCYLGNFGGNTQLAGDVKEVNKRIENTFENGGDNFVGIGSTLEGFDCNPFMYEYIFEKAWDFPTHRDVEAWTRHIADEHIGHADQNAREAWQILLTKVYNRGTTPGHCSVINCRPSIDHFRTYYHSTHVAYDNKDLLRATELLLSARCDRQSHAFDCVNLTRQLLSNLFNQLYSDYVKAYNENNYREMKRTEILMLDLLRDVDELCGTQRTFLMGKWIADAREKGLNDEEKTYYEQNARNLLTTWGEKAALLNDYASRTWNGLVGTFYAERWKMFFAAVNRAVIAGEKFDDAHYDAFSAEVTEYEDMWWRQCIGDFPAEAHGDGIALSRKLVEKYRGMVK